MDWREAETKRPRRRDTARASLGGDTQTEQARGNQAQGGIWEEEDPNGPPRSPLHPAWLSSYLDQPWGRGASIQGSEWGGGRASEGGRRPLSPRGPAGPAPACSASPGGGGGSPQPRGAGPGSSRSPGKGKLGYGVRGSSRTGNPAVGKAEPGGSNGTGLDWRSTGSLGRLRGTKRRSRRKILRDRALEEESTAIPRGPGPRSAESAVQGQGSSRNPRGRGEGSSRSRGRAGEGDPGSQKRAGAESGASRQRSARLLGRKARAGGGFGECSAARRPGLLALRARARPPCVHPSPRVMIRRRSSRSSPARHRAAASPAPCRESGAHPSLSLACPPAL